MKIKHILIALAMLAALSVVSCKNNNKNAQSQEPTQEEVQEMKQALADSVLAEIDALAEQFFDASSKSFRIRTFEVPENEKMVKPDYLLDLSLANTLVTREQKVRALALYISDLSTRMIYDMPLDENKEVIAKLAVEVGGNYDIDNLIGEAPLSEKFKTLYSACRENGDFAYFWQMQYGIYMGISCVIAQNPDLFFSQITEEQWQAYDSRIRVILKAIEELAKYDNEMAQLWEFRNKHRLTVSDEEMDSVNKTKEAAKQFRIKNKDNYLANRNALLQ